MPLIAKSSIRYENWKLDPSGLYLTSPSLGFFESRFQVFISTKVAGNMQEEQNRVNFLRRLDLDASKLAVSNQVHGTQIHCVTSLADCPSIRVSGIDGWLASGVEGVNLGVFSADCMGIFILHRERPLGMVLHAGWKGCARGIIEEAFRLVCENFCKDFKVTTKDFLAVVGPHIGSCCYEVKGDVAGSFSANDLTVRDGKTYLDLGGAAAHHLENLGVQDIVVSRDCTRCREDLFISYRRGDKGSMLNLLHFP